MGTVTKIDIEKLETYITDLQTLHGEWVDKVYSHEDVGENAGYTIAEIVNLSTAYKDMQTSFVNLMDKTITYMENRKAAFESQENTATDTVETSTIVKPGVTGRTPMTK